MPREKWACAYCGEVYDEWEEAADCEDDCEEDGTPPEGSDERCMALCELIERRDDYPDSRVRTPGDVMVRRWLGLESDEPLTSDHYEQLRRWADGTDPLPRRREPVYPEVPHAA